MQQPVLGIRYQYTKAIRVAVSIKLIMHRLLNNHANSMPQVTCPFTDMAQLQALVGHVSGMERREVEYAAIVCIGT